jgi:hypothetical protein
MEPGGYAALTVTFSYKTIVSFHDLFMSHIRRTSIYKDIKKPKSG